MGYNLNKDTNLLIKFNSEGGLDSNAKNS